MSNFIIREASVTITKSVEVQVSSQCFTEKFLNDFEKSFWLLDGEDKSREENLISYIHGYLAQYEDANFIEGVGKAVDIYDYDKNNDNIMVIYKVSFDDLEVINNT